MHLPSSSLRKTSPPFPTAAPAWGPGIPSDTGLLPSCLLSNSVAFGEDVCASQLRLHPWALPMGLGAWMGGWMDRQMDGKQEGRWGLEKGDLWCGGGQGLTDRATAHPLLVLGVLRPAERTTCPNPPVSSPGSIGEPDPSTSPGFCSGDWPYAPCCP